jgi:hypothetical protein
MNALNLHALKLKSSISYAALSLALIAGMSSASAQTYLTPQQIVTVPAATQVTTHTVRTVQPLPGHRQQITTTRTVTQRVLPSSTAVIAGTVASTPQPLYDEVTPAQDVVATGPAYSRSLYDYAGPTYSRPIYDYSGPAYNYSRPLYDDVVTTRPASTMVIDNGSILATQPYVYRYVYQGNRILVVDPMTGEAVQTIPR